MNALQIRDLTYVRACCEHWGSVYLGGGWYRNESPTGRLMRGMPTTRCRCVIKDPNPKCLLCDGTGRVSGDLRAERGIAWKRCTAGCVKTKQADGSYRHLLGADDCFRCAGTGWRRILNRAVNPASISATGFGTYEDVIYRAVGKTVMGWLASDATIWLNKVIVKEYMFNGTQPMKAKQMRISTSWYEKQLHEAHYWIEVGLQCP